MRGPCLQCGGRVRRSIFPQSSFCRPCRKVRRSVQIAARAEVARAIRHGELAHPRTLRCADCGGRACQYDHRDYAKPLEVEPVCRRCNIGRGPGKVKGQKTFKQLREEKNHAV